MLFIGFGLFVRRLYAKKTGVYEEKRQICFILTAKLRQTTMAIRRQYRRRSTTRNSNMAAKTGSTYTSERTVDIIKIQTANLGFRPRHHGELKEIVLGRHDATDNVHKILSTRKQPYRFLV